MEKETKAISLLVNALENVAVSKNAEVNRALAERLSKGAKNWAIKEMIIRNFDDNLHHKKLLTKKTSKVWQKYLSKRPYNFNRDMKKIPTQLTKLQDEFLEIKKRMVRKEGENETPQTEILTHYPLMKVARTRIHHEKLKNDYFRIDMELKDMYQSYNSYYNKLNPPTNEEPIVYIRPYVKSTQPKREYVEDNIVFKMRENIKKHEKILELLLNVKERVLKSLTDMHRNNYLLKNRESKVDSLAREFATKKDIERANEITSDISENFSEFMVKMPSVIKTNPSPLEYSNRANWKNPVFSKLYSSRVRNLLYAIKNNDRSLFLVRLKSGELKISKLPEYEIWDIWYKEPKPEDPLPPRAEDMPDGMFKCKKCKSYKTTYVEKQTRSADEPMTIFITCMLCGNVTKI